MGKNCFTAAMLSSLLACGSLAFFMGAAGSADDEQAIRNDFKSLVEAGNLHDAKKVAAHWAPDAVYQNTTSGARLDGRAALEAAFAQTYKDKPDRHIDATITNFRFISPEVALLEGKSTATSRGEEPTEETFEMIYAKKDRQWLLQSVRELERHEAQTAQDRLQELDWLVGTWVDDSPNIDIHTVCQWAAKHSFLTRTYRVVTKAGVEMEGTQIIGWDPVNEKIHSWVFDTDGGFSEGLWTREGNRWLVRMTGVLPDGRTGSSTQIINKINNDSYTARMVARQVEGELLPSLDEVKVVRQTESKTSTPSK